MIEGITAATEAQGTTAAGGGRSSALDKDAFLRLLVAQLNYQDPLAPMENEQFVAQLAQFSSLEQMQNMNKNLEDSINADYLLNQAMNNSLVTTLIGKDVVAMTNMVPFNGTNEATVGVRLQEAASEVTISIYDSAGTLVRTISASDVPKGERLFTWDGKDSQGNTMPAGQYRIAVEGTAADGSTPIAATTFMRGTITGVRYEQGVAILLLGDIELSLGDVERILQKNG